MIDRQDVQLILFEGRGCNKHLLLWMKQFPHRWRARPPNMLYDYLALWRNQQIHRFLTETRLPWVWLMDDDMVPVAETMLPLESDADVAGCRYQARTGHEAHQADGSVGAACLRISRHALETVGPPWFDVKLSPAGTELAHCECTYFCGRMAAAGFKPVKAGRVGHIVPVVLVPGQQPTDPFLVKFPR